jgi:hypothetical protein
VIKKSLFFPILILTIYGLLRSLSPQIRNLQIEDAQTFLFPIFLLAIWWGLRRGESFKLSTITLISLLFVWAVSAANVRGFGASFLKKDTIYLSRFPEDPNSVLGSNYSFYYNRVADHYRAPHMKVIQRKLSNPIQAEVWLNQRDFEKILITPGNPWGRIYLAKHFLLFGEKSSVEPSADILKLSEALSLDENDDFYLLNIPGVELPLAIAIHPTQMQLPMVPEDLLAIFLAKFSKAVASHSLGNRSEYFTQASDVIGPWLTNGPRSLSAYYSATIELFRSISKQEGSADLECLIRDFSKASGLNQGYLDLRSGIYNNLAITYLLSDKDGENLELVKDLLIKASSLYDRENQPYINTKVALLNLMVLDRLGL